MVNEVHELGCIEFTSVPTWIYLGAILVIIKLLGDIWFKSHNFSLLPAMIGASLISKIQTWTFPALTKTLSWTSCSPFYSSTARSCSTHTYEFMSHFLSKIGRWAWLFPYLGFSIKCPFLSLLITSRKIHKHIFSQCLRSPSSFWEELLCIADWFIFWSFLGFFLRTRFSRWDGFSVLLINLPFS